MLEINPNYIVKSEQDTLNKIDARWIDMSSGLFIDITAVRKDEEKRKEGNPEALMCKDHHHYDVSCLVCGFGIWLTVRRRVISFHCGIVFLRVFLLRFPMLIRIFLKRSIVLKHLLGRAFLGMFYLLFCLA